MRLKDYDEREVDPLGRKQPSYLESISSLLAVAGLFALYLAGTGHLPLWAASTLFLIGFIGSMAYDDVAGVFLIIICAVVVAGFIRMVHRLRSFVSFQ